MRFNQPEESDDDDEELLQRAIALSLGDAPVDGRQQFTRNIHHNKFVKVHRATLRCNLWVSLCDTDEMQNIGVRRMNE